MSFMALRYQLMKPNTDQNDALFERARQSIPGGVNSPVRAFKAVGGTPRFVQRAQGAYFWDANNQRFIDYIRSTCVRYIELKPLLRLVERIEGIAVPNAYAFGRV